MKFKQCEYCSASLDFGKRCNCREEAEAKRKRLESLVTQDTDGQLELSDGIEIKINEKNKEE